MKTGLQLVGYCKEHLGTPYFYGAKMQKLTESFMQQMHKQYPGTVTNSYISKAKKKGMVGQVCADCSGLIGGFRGKQIGSAQLYSSAKKRMPISQINHFAIGTVLWKSGHVGVYIGMEDGEHMCIEAKGIDYGTVKTKVSATKWQYGLTFDDISYDYDVPILGKDQYKNPYPTPVASLKKGMKSEYVKWLQFELNEAGYSIVIDGSFGPATQKAVIAFQKSCKIEVDGVVGSITRGELIKR